VKLIHQRSWAEIGIDMSQFRMKHIFPLGQAYAQGIMKVLARKKAEKTQAERKFFSKRNFN